MSLTSPPRSPASDIPPTFGERAAELRRDVVPALRLLRERSWIYALLGVVFLSICFVFLGRWQFDRHLSRTAKNNQITSNYAAVPVPLDSVLPPASGSASAPRVPRDLQWRAVRMTGTYLAGQTVLIRNRPYSTTDNDSRNGYEVLVPLKLASGTILLVNRGWIPTSDTSALRPDTVPAPPSGSVSVVARLRPSEAPSTKRAPAGQAININAPQLAARMPADQRASVINGFAVLASETPPAAATPAELDPPDPGIGINLAYAVQWWLFAVTAYVLFGVFAVKEVRRRAT